MGPPLARDRQGAAIFVAVHFTGVYAMKTDVEKRTMWLKVLATVAIIGAINWGLVGFFNFNLVDAIFGGGARETTSAASRVIYALVGLAGLAMIALLPKAVAGGPGTPPRRPA